ncbi:ABC transporter permease [Halogranum rubrum]|uniref:ABC-type transport system permease protein (Probable substrate dipeptides/oligopeptides) n=1 Tax=Halogranum salarium B-1 TaxID=1210908 RepID=J3JD29_9EURY|nr:ABC transporter permease [Halogranum salarium]EJN57129.1 ABC-type transport system permease protein (probable substrate dipeptides/oligopeptides) [Halogranum salarium B-1]
MATSTFSITSARKERMERFVRKFRNNTKAMIGLTIVVLLVLVAIFAPVIAPYEIDTTSVEDRSEAPSVAHPFGTDDLGRDIFSRVVMGSRISLYVGFGAISAALLVGTVIGVVSGYYGGMVDELLMRLMDAAMSFPPILLALTLMVVLGPDLNNVILALAFVYTPYIARVGRSATLSETNEAYVESAIARGESSGRIIFSEVLPNTTAPLLVQGSLNIAFAMLAEASLSFLGLGAQPPTPSWGLMIDTGRGFMQSAPWMIIFPGLAIAITVIGFNMLGDGLRDILDPKVDAIE